MIASLEGLQAALQDRYVLERKLGQGGMATVYLAEDVKHHRKVAVKVLRPELAASLGVERFFREIQIAAQLQHPHILPLLDSGEADGFLYYVMPYVEGESLRDRLVRQGELPVHDAVKLLCEIADALAYAHTQGVVHRDMKPDNVMLSGRHALVMDFGVAKAVSAATGGHPLTTAGVALGTPMYMAPEQAAADPHLDHRVDIYAVGVIGYELLAGRPPFTGTTQQQVLAAHLSQSPEPVTTLRPTISPALAYVIMKCLAKRPADRWQSADDLLSHLEPLLTPSGETTPTGIRPVGSIGQKRWLWPWAVGSGLFLILGATVLLLTSNSAAAIRFGRRTQVTLDPGLEIDPAISYDGQFVAYAAGPMTDTRLYVRQLGGGTPIPVAPELERPQRLPSWSRDGKRILFRSPRGIEVIPALGGVPKLLVQEQNNGTAIPQWASRALMPGSWSPDNQQCAYVRTDSLYIVALEGGSPRLLAHGGELHSCAWSPDGRWIACVRGNRQSLEPGFFFGNLGQSAIWLIPTTGGEPIRVTDEQSFNASPAWMPGGKFLFFISNRDGGRDVYQVALSRSGKPAAPPTRLTTGLNAQTISLSTNGRRLAYSVFTESSNIWSLPIPAGAPVSVSQARPLTTGNQVIETFSISPDGSWLAFDSDRSGYQDIYRMPLPSGEPEQLTADSSEDFWPVWSPDGQEIAFHSFRKSRRHLFIMPADGRLPVQITTGNDDERTAAWTPDGRALYYLHNFNSPDVEVRLTARDTAGRWGAPRTVVRADVLPVAVSPDGRLLAFSSTRGLTLTSLTGDSARILVPVSDRTVQLRPTYVSWSSDGRSIYYLALDPADRASIWSVARGGGTPRLLVRFDDSTKEWHRFGFAAHDGRFYFTLGDRQSDIWTSEVESIQ